MAGETRYGDRMSDFAWVALVAVLLLAVAGIVAGVIMRPHEPWKGVFESAAAATGVVVALLVVAVLVALVAHPSNKHGDQEAGVQVVFVALLAIPMYVPALAGAVVGKLLGRQLRRPRIE
jgi:cytochrome b561